LEQGAAGDDGPRAHLVDAALRDIDCLGGQMIDATPEGSMETTQDDAPPDLSHLDEDRTLARIHVLIKQHRGKPGKDGVYPAELGLLLWQRAQQLAVSEGTKASVWKVADDLGLSPAVVSRLLKLPEVVAKLRAMRNSMNDKTNSTNGHSKPKAKTKPSPPAKPKGKPGRPKKAVAAPIVIENAPSPTVVDLTKHVWGGLDRLADEIANLGRLPVDALEDVPVKHLSAQLQRAGTDLKTLLKTIKTLTA
jgi:hypothetical protein